MFKTVSRVYISAIHQVLQNAIEERDTAGFRTAPRGAIGVTWTTRLWSL